MLDWIRHRQMHGPPSHGVDPAELEGHLHGARSRILDAFELALQAREPQLGLMDHAARVAMVAGRIAEAMGIGDGDRYILNTAAQLHEMGMLSLPADLIERRGTLSPQELQWVRGQARVSADIARAAYHPRIALLIENQYRDHAELRRDGLSERDLVLAGIFRVADVFATVTWPRPYQAAMSAPTRSHLLQSGAGTRFDPLAVHAALSAL